MVRVDASMEGQILTHSSGPKTSGSRSSTCCSRRLSGKHVQLAAATACTWAVTSTPTVGFKAFSFQQAMQRGTIASSCFRGAVTDAFESEGRKERQQPLLSSRFTGLNLAGSGAVAALVLRRQRRIQCQAQSNVDAVFDTIPVVPESDEEKGVVEREIYEGITKVSDLDDTNLPSGQAGDDDKVYFWKMGKDRRTIDVIFPVEDHITRADIVFRLGEEAVDMRRGPTLEMGYRYKNEKGRWKENLILDGQVLNAINRADTYWTLEDMAGVKVVQLTLTRPTMIRKQHDPVMQRSYEEERIEPQTWDAVFVAERVQPQITDYAFFDISLGGEPAGRIEFGLYGNVLPKTVQNFMGLVTGKYTDDEGNEAEAVYSYKGTTFKSVLPDFLLCAGNPGLDLAKIQLNHEELVAYKNMFLGLADPAPSSGQNPDEEKMGRIKPWWSLRWGADLGVPDPERDPVEEGTKEGDAISVEAQNKVVTQILNTLVDKGEGAELIFFRPEWERGCDMTGRTFAAENFSIPHSRRGLLSMDKDESSDQQGSVFFITLREFPEMDKRWSVFGEVLRGMDVVEKIEAGYEGNQAQVKIADCGIAPKVDVVA
mmetsp:Transcript_44735/g.88577  ORF Transcript_44735/g.88577 Transcript_44735/m.88577 type:complete len:597 (-) Transcript_44735:16-1806(-)